MSASTPCPIRRSKEPTDAIVQITSTGICGSDLHLYEVLGPFLERATSSATSRWAFVEDGGPRSTALRAGDRVVVPFNVSCGTCFMCGQGLHSQCETTQVREQGKGAALFGYTKLYGQVPGGQAEYLRVPFGNTLPIKVPDGPPDDRFVYLSDVLPTAWQAVEYADVPPGGSWPCWGWARSATWPCGSRGTAASARHRHRPRARAAGARRATASGPRPRRARRGPRRRPARPDRRPRPRFGDRRGRHGGARLAGRQAGAPDHRAAARRHGREDDGDRRLRPAERALHRDRAGPARRHDLAQSGCTAAWPTRCR